MVSDGVLRSRIFRGSVPSQYQETPSCLHRLCWSRSFSNVSLVKGRRKAFKKGALFPYKYQGAPRFAIPLNQFGSIPTYKTTRIKSVPSPQRSIYKCTNKYTSVQINDMLCNRRTLMSLEGLLVIRSGLSQLSNWHLLSICITKNRLLISVDKISN